MCFTCDDASISVLISMMHYDVLRGVPVHNDMWWCHNLWWNIITHHRLCSNIIAQRDTPSHDHNSSHIIIHHHAGANYHKSPQITTNHHASPRITRIITYHHILHLAPIIMHQHTWTLLIAHDRISSHIFTYHHASSHIIAPCMIPPCGGWILGG